jgi:hypothetical protein
VFNHSLYPDSELRCKSVWDTFNDADKELCFTHTLQYIQVKKDENRRHNPLNYLQKRMFDITSPHFFELEQNKQFTNGDTLTIDGYIQTARERARMIQCFGEDDMYSKQDQFRNKVIE